MLEHSTEARAEAGIADAAEAPVPKGPERPQVASFDESHEAFSSKLLGCNPARMLEAGSEQACATIPRGREGFVHVTRTSGRPDNEAFDDHCLRDAQPAVTRNGPVDQHRDAGVATPDRILGEVGRHVERSVTGAQRGEVFSRKNGKHASRVGLRCQFVWYSCVARKTDEQPNAKDTVRKRRRVASKLVA